MGTKFRQLGGRSSFDKDHSWDIIKVIQKTGGYCTTFKENEIGTLQGGGMNVMDKVPNIIVQINPSKESGGKQPYQQNRVYDTDGILPALSSEMGYGTHAIISHYGHTDKDAVISEIVPTLKANSHGHEPMIGNTNMNGETFENDFAGTLRSGASHNYQLVNNIRRLTEIECERLQGYKDNWTKFGNYDGEVKEISRTQRYKLCGNAVTVDIVELIGKKLLKK